MNRFTISAATVMLATVLVQGCSKPPPAPALSGARIYAHDMDGKAPLCAVPTGMVVVDGKDNPVAMTTGGGGWCGVPVRGAGGAYAAGLLTQPAQNGRVYVHTVGDDTRIDYIAKPGAIVPDSFAVQLIPGNAVIRVSVTPPPSAPPVGK